MADESHIGLDVGELRFPVERSKIKELAEACLEEDPVYRDPDAARAAGFDRIPAPINFPVLSMHWRGEEEGNLTDVLDLDLRRVLHGEVEWEYHAPVAAGDELTGRREVADVTTREGKRGGTMTIVKIETEYVNEAGDLVLRQTDTLIETGG